MEPSTQEMIFYILIASLSILSILGCIFIVTVYLSFKQLRIFSFKLILYLTIADFGHSLGNINSAFIIPKWINQPFCTMQALLDTYFTLSSVIWSGVVAYTLYSVVVLHKRNVEDNEKYYHIISWGLPAITCILPFITDSYEYYDSSSLWCWIKSDKEFYNIIWQGVSLYIPLWSVILFNIFCYFRIIRAINNQIDFLSTDENYKNQLMRRLKLYPAILVICYSLTSFYRFIQFIDIIDSQDTVLPTVALAISTLVGFLNAVVYGLNPTVKVAIREWLESRKGGNYEYIESNSVVL